MSETHSLPGALSDKTLDRLIQTLNLKEVEGEPGDAYMPLMSHAPIHEGRCGHVRLLEGDGIFRVVTCTLVAPTIHLDSHMIFAFMPSSSPVPHFTLDSVQHGDHFAFHLDLIPRVDLGANYTYSKWAYGALTGPHEQASAIEGLEPAHISPMQRSIMSPWMMVNRANESAFTEIEATVNTYLDHWFSLVRSGAPADVTASTDAAALQARDKANKELIFSPEIDKVWDQIRGLIGDEAVQKTRDLLMAAG